MSKKQPLINASAIIERFGGIRPMASKIDTPVTTVQGWKKRDVIPGTRRAQILSAASANNIDLSDLAEASVSNENVTAKPASKKTSVKKAVSKKSTKKKVVTKAGEVKKSESVLSASASKEEKQDEKLVEEKTVEASKLTSSVPSVSASPSPSKTTYKDVHEEIEHERLISEIKRNNQKAMASSAWIATGLILLALAVGAFLFWPHFKAEQQKREAQSQQLVSLENEVNSAKNLNIEAGATQDDPQGFLGATIPEELQNKLDGLQNQARNISMTVDQLSERAKKISTDALGDATVSVSKRLDILETKVAEISGPEGTFSSVVARIRDLENTVGGKAQLENSANQLRSIIDGTHSKISGEDLSLAQDGEAAGPLGRTLEGVSGPDLKAAAILIAFSQFRSSLEREAPFEQDLALLQKLVGDDNPELQENLIRLSQHADGGVLTTSGLASELKKMTGDIVVSSLAGEDVSIAEKAKARFGGILQVEKDGEIISGTKTQATISKAQDYIEAGKIEDGIVTLEGLDGEAAVTAKPFIEKAQASLLADKVKAMLNESILSKTGGSLDGVLNLDGVKSSISNVDMNEIKENLEKAVPSLGGEKIVKDKESGISILPKSQGGFKGFSGGQ